MGGGRRIGLLFIVLAVLCAFPSIARDRQDKRTLAAEYVGSVALPSDLHGLVPQDVDAHGRLLVLGFPNSFSDGPALLNWNIRTAAFDTRIGLTWSYGAVGPFRFVDQTGEVVGLEGRRVVLVNLLSRSVEVAAEVPDVTPSSSAGSFFRASFLAVDNRQHKFAAFFNNEAAKKPEVMVCNSRSKSPCQTWALPRFVQGAAWSPDGEKLAVLYSGACDDNLKYYDVNMKRKLLTLPDVAVFDARSGRLEFSFYSGQPESQIAYSPDGRFLYCVVDSGLLPLTFFRHPARDAIRVFSSADGKLERVIRVANTGVRSSLAFSPDGNLLVADASTLRSDLFHDPGNKRRDARFVVLNAEPGATLLTSSLGLWRSKTPIKIFFSSDSKTLVVDPDASRSGEGPVKVYRLLESP